EKIKIDNTPDNGWFGVTITSSKEKYRINELRNNIKAKHYHLTFEPMFDDVGNLDLTDISWIVIGTETGNRKNKGITKKKLIKNIYNQYIKYNIPIFMKENLFEILSVKEIIQDMPIDFGGMI